MATWGASPFESDSASDFLDAAESSPSRSVAKALTRIDRRAAEAYLDANEGAAAWAACALVALAFGRADAGSLDDRVLDLAAKLPPKEELRVLALRVQPRLLDRSRSELAALWHGGSEGPLFDGAMEDLRVRLEAASDGPLTLAKTKAGDVIALPVSPQGSDLVVVQVVGAGEVAVFDGTCSSDAEALACVRQRRAQRVPTSVNKLLRRGRLLGSAPVRKDVRGTKLYAGEFGSFDQYVLSRASAGGARLTSYTEAKGLDALRPYAEDAIRDIALGKVAVVQVRSPAERRLTQGGRNSERWTTLRETTTPGPFGDVALLERLLAWLRTSGISHIMTVFQGVTADPGPGRLDEEAERRRYAFAGLVALWLRRLPADDWPASLAGQLPEAPDPEALFAALACARVLAARVLSDDAELRRIWDRGSDGGAELRRQVARLQTALAG